MTTETVHDLGTWLKKWWFVITAFASISAAWGADHVKLAELTEVVKEQSIIRREVKDLQVQSARVDERTKIMIDMMTKQQETQDDIKKTVKSTNKAVKSNQSPK